MDFFKDLVLLLAGLALAGLGCYLFWNHQKEERLYTDHTSGIVTDIKEVVRFSKGRNKVKKYMPIYTYTVEGIKYDTPPHVQYNTPDHHPIGMPVTVFYNPSNPEQCYIEEERQPVGPLVFFAVGVVFMLASRPWRFFLLAG